MMQYSTLEEYIIKNSKIINQDYHGSDKSIDFEISPSMQGKIGSWADQKRDCGEFYTQYYGTFLVGKHKFDVSTVKDAEIIFNMMLENKDNEANCISLIKAYLDKRETIKYRREVDKEISHIKQSMLTIIRDLTYLGEIEEVDDDAEICALLGKLRLSKDESRKLDEEKMGTELFDAKSKEFAEQHKKIFLEIQDKRRERILVSTIIISTSKDTQSIREANKIFNTVKRVIPID